MYRSHEALVPLFRIRKVFEIDQLTLYKIEGALAQNNADSWAREFNGIIQNSDRVTIFDCACLTTTIHELRDMVRNLMTDNMYFLNLPTPARNMLRSAGLGEKVLD